MQSMAMGQQQAFPVPGQPHPMMHGGVPQQMQMQHSPQQFVQTLGQIPQQQPQFGQGTNNAQQMQQFLLQQQLQQTMQNAKPHLQQPPPMQMQGFNQGMPQQNQAAKMMMPGTQAQLTNLLLGQQSLANANSTPIDILGLADKAAQALSGGLVQGAQQMNGHRSNNPNFPPPPAPAPAQSFHQQQPMASEKDLPMMVQYAIQNLRTTGHIERTLDPPLCAMLKRLPEHAALQALEIFSSCDLSKMRNKGAYLSGILKKELIKLGL